MVEPELIPAPFTPSLMRITTARELAALLGVDYAKELSFVMHRMRRENKYKAFNISKRNGGERVILAPNKCVLNIQRRLLPLLSEIYRAPSYVNGYISERSIITNARRHIGQRYLVNIDLKDFFPSIKFNRVVGILASSRYSLSLPVAKAIAQICCFEGSLPIGAPTSGIISNIICGPLDKALIKLAREHGLTYSRYADDITFSTNNPLNMRRALGISLEGAYIERNIDCLSNEFINIIESKWFKVNESKVWVTTKQVRQVVTGLVVNKKLNVKAEYYRNIRAAISAIEKHGYERANIKYEIDYKKSDASLERHLRGKLSHFGNVVQYNSKYTSLALRFNKLFPTNNIKIPYIDKFKATYVLFGRPSAVQGTCVHIGKGIFLSASHNFNSRDICIQAKCPDYYDGFITLEVIDANSENDIAVLRSISNVNDRSKIDISSRGCGLNDIVNVLGFPNFVEGNSLTAIPANIISQRRIFGVKKFDIDKPLYHGISGGPVVNESGLLVGLAYSGPEYGSDHAPLSVAFSPIHDSYSFIAGILAEA